MTPVFCPHDKALLKLQAGELACPRCGYRRTPDRSLVVKGPPEERRLDKFSDLGVIDDPEKFDMQIWPIDDQVFCGGCGNRGAYYYQRQTRKSDEPPTTFYQCTKCKRKWKRSK